MTMKSTERRELRAIIKGKFELLQAELRATAEEFERAAIKEVDARFAAKLAKADKACKEMRAKGQALVAEAHKIQERLAKEGVVYQRGYQDKMFFGFSVRDDQWSIAEREKEVQKVRQEIQRQRSAAHTELRRRELSLYETLSLDALESEQAREFLGKIPEVSELMRPVNVRALKAA